MARRPRIHLPGGVYHVMLRGNGGREIFRGAGDGTRFLDLLDEGRDRFGFRCHGYCLMPNHVHLVLQAGAEPLSRPMQNLAFRYSRHVNARGGRAGHLFQGRYKAILVDADRYLLELVRYVHLNPVRAGLCDGPEAWRWSGHRAYLGREPVPWLTTGWVLSLLGPDEREARAAYVDFVADGIGGARRTEFHAGNGGGGRVLGDDAFVERALAAAGERPDTPPPVDAIVAAAAETCGVDAATLAGPSRARDASAARGLAGLVARETGAATLAALAARFGRDLSSLSRAVRRAEDAARTDPAAAMRVAAVRNAITQA